MSDSGAGGPRRERERESPPVVAVVNMYERRSTEVLATSAGSLARDRYVERERERESCKVGLCVGVYFCSGLGLSLAKFQSGL